MQRRRFHLVALALLSAAPACTPAPPPPPVAAGAPLSREAMRQFLLEARIVGSERIGRGVTNPWRLTLTDGVLTHDAAFQPVDARDTVADSYHYTLAAYAIAGLIGLDDLMPVTVEREWQGARGALSWWIEAAYDEASRARLGIEPPDFDAWRRQMYRMLLLSTLVCDMDRNAGNLLITDDWRLYAIDFTRAFRDHVDLPYADVLARGDAQVLAKLRRLTPEMVRTRVGSHLTEPEIAAVMVRRDRIVAHFDRLVATRGAGEVLY